jgi:hypothetical protein
MGWYEVFHQGYVSLSIVLSEEEFPSLDVATDIPHGGNSFQFPAFHHSFPLWNV